MKHIPKVSVFSLECQKRISSALLHHKIGLKKSRKQGRTRQYEKSPGTNLGHFFVFVSVVSYLKGKAKKLKNT